MQTYTTESPTQQVIEIASKSPKQKVIEQLNQFVLALAELRFCLGDAPQAQAYVELLEAGVQELEMTVAREWVTT
jgi:hypothetical protein